MQLDILSAINSLAAASRFSLQQRLIHTSHHVTHNVKQAGCSLDMPFPMLAWDSQ